MPARAARAAHTAASATAVVLMDGRGVILARSSRCQCDFGFGGGRVRACRLGQRTISSAPVADAAYRLSELIAAAARDLGRTSPPPRGVPFFGLDHPSGSAIGLLEGLASHGIFRKYERVLDLSAHLGMSSRWLATVLGCTAVATAPSTTRAVA